MTQYSYQGISRMKVWFSQLTGILGMIFSSIMAICTILGIRFLPQNNAPLTILNDPKITLVCFAIWFLVIGWSVSLTLLNSLPTLWVNEDGIYISAYLFFKIKIPWSNIVDIKVGTIPFGYILVRTRKISIFHKIYGWTYTRTLYPSFLIGKDISNRDKLLSEISQRINTPT